MTVVHKVLYYGNIQAHEIVDERQYIRSGRPYLRPQLSIDDQTNMQK